MKRKIIIIFTLIITLFSFKNVYALESWTDDGNIINYFNIISTEKRYRWYQEKLIDQGYNNNTDIDLNETYIDEEDFITEYTNWDIFDGNIKDNLEFRKLYTYQTINSLRWIEISSLKMFARISEIEIFVDNKKVDYNIGCSTCDVRNQDLSILHDGIISSSNTFYLNTRTKISLLLNEEYPMDKIKIIIHFLNTNDNNYFNLYFTNEQYNYDNIIAKENIDMPLSIDNNIESVSLNIDENWSFNTKYINPIKTLEEIKPSWYTKVEEEIESREIIKKYRYYNIEREYLDGYYKESPYPNLNLKQDKDDYKIFYKYEVPEFSDEFEYFMPDIENSYSNIYPSNNIDLSSLLNQKFENPGIDIEELLKEQTNSFNIEDFYKVPDLSNLNYYSNNNLNDEEKIVKTDKSKFKNSKVDNNNVSKYINFKLLLKISIALSILILFFLLINKRYRKS